MGKAKKKITFSSLREKLKKIKDNGNDYDSKLMNLLGMSEDVDGYKKWLQKRNKGLGSIQSQKNRYLCKEWKDKPIKFRIWYLEKYIEQSGLCKYCKVPQKFILEIYNRPKGWRVGKKTQDNKKGTRGWSLEIDRKNPEKNYGPDNCALVCYPCNNAKSDVFGEGEFKNKIGESIKAVWAKKVLNLKDTKKKKEVLEFIKITTELKNDKTIKDILKKLII